MPAPPPYFSQPLDRRSSPGLWVAFFLSAITAAAFFFVPAFIIRPFGHQAPRALVAAMAFRQRAPMATVIAAAACFLLALTLWRTTNRWGKSLLGFALVIVTFSAVMARLNYFEWMFHP